MRLLSWKYIYHLPVKYQRPTLERLDLEIEVELSLAQDLIRKIGREREKRGEGGKMAEDAAASRAKAMKGVEAIFERYVGCCLLFPLTHALQSVVFDGVFL